MRLISIMDYRTSISSKWLSVVSPFGLNKDLKKHEIRPIAVEEFDKIINAEQNLGELQESIWRYQILELNHKSYANTINFAMKRFVKRTMIDTTEMNSMAININKAIINYLFAVRTFLDHSETNLKKQFGKESQEVINFKKATFHAKETSFAYRFLYKLRNYVQHCGMPLSALSLGTHVDPNSKNQAYFHILLKLNRDFLLNNYDSWGSKLKEEIKKLPNEFDIGPLISEMNKCIDNIAFSIIKNKLPEYYKNAKYLQSLINETKGFEGIPCILEYTENLNGGISIKIQWFPMHTIKDAYEFKERFKDKR